MFSPLKTAGSALGACLLGLAPAAHADVIETGAAGFRWVAGPLAQASQHPPADQPSAGANPAFTQAVETAGPEFWRDYVRALAVKYQISPALLEAVVWQESRWRTALTSRAGAHGLAQLMPETARNLGVDLRNPYANLDGGAHYLRIQLDAFKGDVEKALAAYNAGPGRVEQAGGVPNIAETKAYVAAIMARLAENVRR